MKRLHLFFATVTLLAVILTSCAGGQATEPPQPEVSPTEVMGPTVAPASPTAVVDLPTATPTFVPIDIAGPPMEVGSMFQYVDGSTLVAVPGGEFTMGYGAFDNPEHVVSVSDFWIYRAKVTNQQFAACVAAGVCTQPRLQQNPAYVDPERANDPVVGVTWDQAETYCNYVNARLPTEAEWEKTARGPQGNIWPWGDQAPSCSLLNYRFCVGTTTDVTEYLDGMSYYEALDMSGNAFEWVADWYKIHYYDEAPEVDPLGPELGERRSVRGSSFESGADMSISATRYSRRPVDSEKDLGFRCVVKDPTYYAPACEQLAVYGEDAVAISGAPNDQDLINGCPPSSIVQGKFCGPKDTPYTVVTFHPPPPLGVIDAGTCAPTGISNKFVCSSEEAVSVSAACFVDVIGEPACSLGYTFDPVTNTCQYEAQGTAGQCLPGMNYDTTRQCCRANDAADASSSFALCPPGTYYDGTFKTCFDVPVTGVVSTSATVALKDCIGTKHEPECDPAVDPACGNCPNGGKWTCGILVDPKCVPSPTRGPCETTCDCR